MSPASCFELPSRFLKAVMDKWNFLSVCLRKKITGTYNILSWPFILLIIKHVHSEAWCCYKWMFYFLISLHYAGASHQHQILLRGDGGVWIGGPGWAGVRPKRHLLKRRRLRLHLWQLLAGQGQTLHHLRSERNLLLLHWGGVWL